MEKLKIIGICAVVAIVTILGTLGVYTALEERQAEKTAEFEAQLVEAYQQGQLDVVEYLKTTDVDVCDENENCITIGVIEPITEITNEEVE